MTSAMVALDPYHGAIKALVVAITSIKVSIIGRYKQAVRLA